MSHTLSAVSSWCPSCFVEKHVLRVQHQSQERMVKLIAIDEHVRSRLLPYILRWILPQKITSKHILLRWRRVVDNRGYAANELWVLHCHWQQFSPFCCWLGKLLMSHVDLACASSHHFLAASDHTPSPDPAGAHDHVWMNQLPCSDTALPHIYQTTQTSACCSMTLTGYWLGAIRHTPKLAHRKSSLAGVYIDKTRVLQTGYVTP